MPAALETSKRKFHKLLDSLTGASSGDRPGTPTTSIFDGEGASKRQRLTPRSRLAASHPLVNSSTNLRAIRRIPSSALSPGPKEQDVRVPNFAPWSRDHFQTRLKTFSNVTWWGSKPTAINEVAWSKRGWTCEGKNRVACKGGCEERIVISLRPRAKGLDGKDLEGSEDFSVEVSEDLVKRYEQLVIDGHKEDCLWRESGCADDIMRMPLARPTIWQPSLQERYASFYTMRETLPGSGYIKQPCDLETISNQLGPGFFTGTEQNAGQPDTQHTLDQVALEFALLGWHGHKEPGKNAYPTAICPECFRRVGLWLYAKRPSTSSSVYSHRNSSLAVSQTQPNADVDAEDVDEESKLDLADSHKEYCPWINATSQATPGPLAGMSGWEILQKVISNWASLRARATRAQERQGLVPRPETPNEGTAESVDESSLFEEEVEVSQAELTASREEVRKQDSARFARLRELSRMIGLKSFKGKPGKENQGA